jgi:hypothetical protein
MPGQPTQEDLEAAVEAISRAADGAATIRVYKGCMKQMQTFFQRKVCSDLDFEGSLEVESISCEELLSFMAWKKSLWNLWWSGKEVESNVWTHSFQKILKDRKDIIDAYKLRVEDPKVIQNLKRWLSECCSVMEFLEEISINIVIPGHEYSLHDALTSLQLSQRRQIESVIGLTWKELFTNAFQRLDHIWRQRNPSAKRRKHDLTRLTVRSLYDRILELQRDDAS